MEVPTHDWECVYAWQCVCEQASCLRLGEQLHRAIVSTALPKNAKRTVAAFIWNDEHLINLNDSVMSFTEAHSWYMIVHSV